MDLTEHEERQIRQYVESQIGDEEDHVTLVQRVGRRRIAGHTHEIYDVWMEQGDRWWVITDFTNLYLQSDFNDVDQAFTYHLGLCAVLRERFRVEPDEEAAEYVGRAWRRFAKAADAMSEAEEAEDYQAVAIRCREALLALARDHLEADWLDEGAERPKSGDFKGWMQLHAAVLTTGRSRAYLVGVAERCWDLTVWLQHYSDATEWDAEMVLEATAHMLRLFALAVFRHQRSGTRRCPACDSYRLTEDGDVEERDGRPGYARNDVCLGCGWTSDREFEAFSLEYLQRLIEYAQGGGEDVEGARTGSERGTEESPS